MPRYCTACAHKDAGEIAKAIAAGGSNRAIAHRFGVTGAAIQRHRVNCLRAPRRVKESGAGEKQGTPGAALRFESPKGEITSPKDLLSRLSALFRLGDLLEEAYERRDVDALVKLAREYRAAAESYAKLAGWLVEGGGNTTLIDARRQSITLLSKLTEEELRALAAGSETPKRITDNRALSGAPDRDRDALTGDR
jgi:hypothetical protein